MIVLSFIPTAFNQKLDGSREGSLVVENENQDSPASDPSNEFKHRRSSSRWNEELSPAGSTVTDSTQAGELFSGLKVAAVCSILLLKQLLMDAVNDFTTFRIYLLFWGWGAA